MHRSLVLLLLCACAKKAPAPAEPTPAEEPAVEAPTPEESAAAKLHMSEHFARTLVARDAYVQGELAQAREALAWIGAHPSSVGMPEGAAEHISWMRERAEEGGLPESDAATVALSLAEVGAACADCHTAAGLVPAIPVGDAPPKSEELGPHMARHQWAVSAMWAGLVSGDGEQWRAGCAALDDVPHGFEGISEESQAAATAAHDMAKVSGEAPRADRAQAYATVVSACAGCHAEMRGE